MALKKYLTAKSDNIFIVAKNDWFVWLTVCGWILNLNIVGLGDTVQDTRSLLRAVSNQRWHWKRIQWKIKDGQYFELVCLAGSVWLDTHSISILWD